MIFRMIMRAAVVLNLVFGIAPVAMAQQGSAGDASKRAFKQLVEGTRKEKQVYIFAITEATEVVVPAFKRYLSGLGLELEVKLDATGGSFEKISQAIGETKQGIAPTYDVQFGGAHEVIHLMDAKGVMQIPNVELLLAEIAPEAQSVFNKLSPGPFKGKAFTFGHWIKAIIYNPKLISAAELPRTHKELANPKYKGTFAIPPWTSDADAAVLVYDKDEALEMIRGIGKNKAATEREAAAVNRMLLGEFKFADANAHYYHLFKKTDANAPIGVEFFQDYTTVNEAMYFVREGARHPNAATLFVLWTLSKEGQAVFEAASQMPNIYLPSSAVGKDMMKMIRERNVKLVSYVDNEDSIKKLRWLGETKEGQAWTKAVGQAWRGR